MYIIAGSLTLTVLITGAAPVTNVSEKPAMQSAPHGQRANRWRYEFYEGRWWYWKTDAQWSYFDGRRWVDVGQPLIRLPGRPGLARRAPSQTAPRWALYGRLGAYPSNYVTPTAPSVSTIPPQGTAGAIGGGALRSFGADTIAGGGVGVGSDTGSRSGDAGSGVGGGSVGGADVSGWYRPK